MKKYDYLIVGSGLSGAVFAHEAVKAGKKCIVLERRPHVGGNAYTEDVDGITVHSYGAHIFHTDSKKIWEYMSGFAQFENFINSPVARYGDECYNLPFNMNTFSKLWRGVVTPDDAKKMIEKERQGVAAQPSNLEEQAIKLVGRTVYEKLIKGYTQKQWGRPCNLLPPSILTRVPVRFTYDNNYFTDAYQGIPKGGYTPIIEKMLDGAEVVLNCDFFENGQEYAALSQKIVYTGAVDEYFSYSLGELEYRSLRFERERIETEDFQGVAVVNYTAADPPYTRIIEHKHFKKTDLPYTVITREYPQAWARGRERYYPVNDKKNAELYGRYARLAQKEKDVIFLGRLAKYAYMDMDDAVAAALMICQKEFK